jgi:hypothetical protein
MHLVFNAHPLVPLEWDILLHLQLTISGVSELLHAARQKLLEQRRQQKRNNCAFLFPCKSVSLLLVLST